MAFIIIKQETFILSKDLHLHLYLYQLVYVKIFNLSYIVAKIDRPRVK